MAKTNQLKKEEHYYVPDRIHVYVKSIEEEEIYVTVKRDWDSWSRWIPREKDDSFNGHYRLLKSDDGTIRVSVRDRYGVWFHSFYLRENGLYRITIESDESRLNHRVILPEEEKDPVERLLRTWRLPTSIICRRKVKPENPYKFKNTFSRCDDIHNEFWCSDALPVPSTPPNFEVDKNNPNYYETPGGSWNLKIMIDKRRPNFPILKKLIIWEDYKTDIGSLERVFSLIGLIKPQAIILPS